MSESECVDARERMAELVSDARVEALGMAGAGQEARTRGEITAAALRAHGALCSGLGRSVPVTAFSAPPGVWGLTTFLAVYAAEGRAGAAAAKSGSEKAS
ncbi:MULTISPECIES: hypothetical protein [unclassified Streptomyces]|uniref:hypothetical protein n=1 Tax=unclassified Streptomyces TaxID=2593676 RepID=UPI0037FD8F85